MSLKQVASVVSPHDLVFISPHFFCGRLDSLLKVGNSDHDSQLLTALRLHKLEVNENKTFVPIILYKHLSYLVSLIDWHAVFSRCSTTDSCAERFTDVLLESIRASTCHKPITRRKSSPKYVVHLLHAKKRAWHRVRVTKCDNVFKQLSRTARAAIRQHRRS